MDKRIPEIKMPTEKSLRAASSAWYAPLAGTMLDELPPDVLALSVPTKFIDFPIELAGSMFGDGAMKRLSELADEMDSAMGWNEHFIKLNSRSAKDCWDGITCSGRHALSNFSCSMRILGDLASFRWLNEAKPKICLRELFFGNNGPGTWEFRCFVKDGDLIAVSDYDYTKPNPGITNDIMVESVRGGIDRFFADLHPRMALETYVFDMVFTGRNKMLLIEVNPYGLSDPCFFKTYKNVENASGGIQTKFIDDEGGE